METLKKIRLKKKAKKIGIKELKAGPVVYNETCAGQIFNILFAVIRLFFLFPTLIYCLSSLSMLSHYESFWRTELLLLPFYQIYILLFRLAATVIVVYDSVTIGPVHFGLASFSERSKLSILSHWAGLGGNLGLVVFRLTMYFIMLLASDYADYDRLLFPSKHADGGFYTVYSSSEMYKIGIQMYLCVSIAETVLSRCCQKSVAHPWSFSYVPDPADAQLKGRYLRKHGAALMIANIVFALFVAHANVFITAESGFSNSEFWDTDPKSIFEALVCTALLLLFVARNTYLLFRRLYSKEVATSYFFGFLFAFYVACTIALRFQNVATPYKKVLLFGSFAMFVGNAAYSALFYPSHVLNACIYLSARVFSRAACYAVLSLSGHLCVIAMGLIAMQSVGMYWIDVHVKWAPLIEALAEAIEIFFEAVVEALAFIVGLLSSPIVGGLLCWFVFSLLLVSIGLMVLPFGFGAPSYVSKKMNDMLRRMSKIFSKVKRFRPTLSKLKNYAVKLRKRSDSLKYITGAGSIVFPAGLMVHVQNMFIMAAAIMGLVSLGIVVADRKALYSVFAFFAFWMFCAAVTSMFLGFLLVYDWIFHVSINLIIVKISFSSLWGLVFLEMAFFVGLVGCVAIMLSYCCVEFGFNEGGEFLETCFLKHCKCRNPCKLTRSEKEAGRKHGGCYVCRKRCCPCCLSDEAERQNVTKEVEAEKTPTLREFKESYDASICDQLCFKACPCLEPREFIAESFGGLVKIAMSKCVSCNFSRADRHDKRPLCPYCCTNGCQVCHPDDIRVDCCTKDEPCNCFCFEFECDTAEETVFSRLFDPLRVGQFVAYSIPVSLCCFSLYYALKSIPMDWIEIKVEAGYILETFIQDLTPVSATDATAEQSNENNSCCPPLELVVGMTTSIVFGFIRIIFSGLGTLFASLTGLNQALSQVENIVVFFMSSVPKIALLAGCFAACGFIVGLSFASAFSGYVSRQSILMVSASMAWIGLVAMLLVPMMLESVLAAIPLFGFTLLYKDGYNYALTAYVVLFVALVALFVDTVAEPIAPVRPVYADGMAADIDAEHIDPLRFNRYVEGGSDLIASRILGIEVQRVEQGDYD